MTNAQQLTARVRAKAKERGISASTLSRKLFGNGNRIDEIDKGGSITMDTFAKVEAELDRMDAQETGEAA